MKSTKLFNNISDDLKKMLTANKPKPGQAVVVQMLNGVPNPEPDEKERSKQGAVLYPKVQIMTQFRIYDKSKDEHVDMVLADGWIGDVPSRTRCFVPGNENGLNGSFFQGKFQVKGGSVRDEELWEILYLSPQRKGTPCPDPTVEQIFEFVDSNTESKAIVSKYDILKKALDLVKDITSQKAQEIMTSLNQPTYQDEQVLMAKIKEFASNKPSDFIAAYNSKEAPIKLIIKKAYDAGELTYDLPTGEIKMGKVSILTLKAESIDAFVDGFTSWISTAANGQDVLASIKSRIEKTAEVK